MSWTQNRPEHVTTHRFLLCLIQNAHHISAAVLRGSLLITSGAEKGQKSKWTQINRVSQTTTTQLTTFLQKKSFRNWMFDSWLIQLSLGALLWGVCGEHQIVDISFSTNAQNSNVFIYLCFFKHQQKKTGRQEREVSVTKCVLFRANMNHPENLIWRAEKSTGS